MKQLWFGGRGGLSCSIVLAGFDNNAKFKECAGILWTWLYMQGIMILYSNEVLKAAQIMLLARL